MPASSNHYTFVSGWRIDAPPAEIYELLSNSLDFVRWWPAVWLRSDLVEPGDARGIGRVIRFVTKGWLPYLLHWEATTIEKDPPHHLAIRASGDFVGEGRWSLAGRDGQTDVTYVWTVEVNQPLVRYLSFLLRPLFAANHRWAMARGEESLKLELARRRARTAEELQRIPPPPQPTFIKR